MERKRKNANFINGVPELLVLKLLSADKLYGYQLVKEIQKLNPQAFDFGEGCIYPILHSLEKDGLLRSEEVPVNGRMRLYYSTTEAGKVRLDELSREWLSTIEGVGRLFGDALGGAVSGLAGLAGVFAASQAAPRPSAGNSEADEAVSSKRAQAAGQF
jgi:PadR family transcriptional regulator PadR